MNLYEIGEVLYKRAKYKDALECFLNLYKEDKEDIELLNYIGDCYLNLKENEKALIFFEEALIIKKSDKSLVNKGRILLILKNFTEAIACLNRALMINRKNHVAYYYLGMCYDEVKDFRASKECFEKAIELDTDNAEYHLKLSIACCKEEDYEEAIKELDAYKMLELYTNK